MSGEGMSGCAGCWVKVTDWQGRVMGIKMLLSPARVTPILPYREGYTLLREEVMDQGEPSPLYPSAHPSPPCQAKTTSDNW